MLVLLIGALLAALTEGAADVIVLNDGHTLLGQVAEPATAGRMRMIVRREWARTNLPERAVTWERQDAAQAATARDQRLRRLLQWKQERPGAADDRLAEWLDRQIAVLQRDDSAPLPLLMVELAPSQVRRVERREAGTARLLRQAWRAGLENPEALPRADLRARLEGRGFALGEVDPARVDDLLALPRESEPQWLARRAATEVRDDPSLWFIRYQGLLLPEDREPRAGLFGAMASQALKGLLPDRIEEDPLPARLREAESKGRVGIVVTTLEMSPDLGAATVESRLLVRLDRGRWVAAIARPARVAATEARPEAADAIAADPQVQSAFALLDNLGLGALGEEARRQSLAMGAATRRALGTARSAFSLDLDALALPIAP